MQQVTRKILGVAVLGAAFASAGTGAASADTLDSVAKGPAQAMHEGHQAADAAAGSVRSAEKDVLKKQKKAVHLRGPVGHTLGDARGL
ncbi:ATP-binding protein [Streptomyces winkii]|uniref:ATP-binding protein n=1 Tax=Streptomyces winkii TaxID=3051178 RepID=UPI0028D41271|nr:ATP-binding protein [Streptomyces sp. DSM 40971]